MIRSSGRWLDARLHLAKFARTAMGHVFPDHWSFLLGEIALYSFIILIATGVYLAMFFHASSADVVYHGSYHALDGLKMSSAYVSALDISLEVPAGLLIRQMHHWAALIFIVAILAHASRIFFTGAYRKPREINWMIGLTLLILAIVNGFLGYSLLDDLLSGIGLRIGYSIALSVPLIGPWLAYVGLGGNVPSPSIIPRLYSLHIFVVPALITALLALHLGILWRQTHTNYPGPRRTDRTIVGTRMYPAYAFKSIALFFLVAAVVAMLGGLVQVDPIWTYGPYNPIAVIPGAQPDWYLGWIEGAMRLFPGINLHFGHWVIVPEVFFPAVLMPGLLFLLLYAYPFLENVFRPSRKTHNVLVLPWQRPFNSAVGSAILMFLLVLLVAGADDVIAVATDTSVVTIRFLLRILVFAAPAATAAVVYLLCIWTGKRRSALGQAAPEPAPSKAGDAAAI